MRFSLTMDEWTSVRNRRYMNVNVREGSSVWNLGLIRAFGSCPASKCLEILELKLSEFGLGLKKHIVSITTDGCPVRVMKKVGTKYF